MKSTVPMSSSDSSRSADRGEPRFGVAHRRRIVAIAGTEVALAVDQRIAHRKILRQPHHRLVRGSVAVRVVFTQHIADHARRLDVLVAVGQPHLPHRVQDAPLHRFLAVTHFGQCAALDYGYGVFEIGALGVVGKGDFVAFRQLGERLELLRAGKAGILDIVCFLMDRALFVFFLHGAKNN